MSSNIKEELSEAYKEWERDAPMVSECCGEEVSDLGFCIGCNDNAEPTRMPFQDWFTENYDGEPRDCGHDEVIANE